MQPFNWMWQDPAENIDRLRHLRAQLEAEEKRQKEQHRLKKSRRIKKLTKLAKAGKLKGNNK